MSGEALGRRLLRLDAVYCAGAGLILVALFMPLARLPAWRATVARIAAANAVAALALVALAALSPALAARLLLAAVAVEVAAFAGGQVAALRR